MYKHVYNYSLEVMTIFFLCDVGPGGATAELLLATEKGRRVVNDGFI